MRCISYLAAQLCRLMRDYLQLELQAAGLHHFDVERVIDDLVLFCMLVGNDFLPCRSTRTLSSMQVLQGFVLHI